MTSILQLPTTDRQYLIAAGNELWKTTTYTLTIASDTEYKQRYNRPNKMITTQIAWGQSEDECVVLEHPTLRANKLPVWNGLTAISTFLGVEEVAAPEKIDGYLLSTVLMFFAPADLLAGLFRDRDLCRKIQQNCVQDMRIRIDTRDDDKKGKIQPHADKLKLPIYVQTQYGVLQIVLQVIDLAKLLNGSLKSTVEAFGGVFEEKTIMDKYKTDMTVPYFSSDPILFNAFIKYSKKDACVLFWLREANKERIRILFEKHGLPVPDKEIFTTGALVSELFTAYIERRVNGFEAYEFFQTKDLKGKERCWKLEDMLRYSTVDFFAKRKNSEKALLALVQGGRAKNELPSIIELMGVLADIDLKSAYVSIQRILTYPLGLPSVYGQSLESKTTETLGSFLKKREREFLPRLWCMTVTGTLNHHQTLVPSKVVDAIVVNSKYKAEDPKIPADFRLYTKEVINGVITSDVLETLRNVCSATELASWMNLKVNAAIWYSADNRCETAEEWYRKTEEHCKVYSNSIEEETDKKGHTVVKDTRSRYWLALPIDDFLKPYADERDRIKALQEKCEVLPTDTEEVKAEKRAEFLRLEPLQEAMKLVGNTNYGVMASPYFDIGNVVVANNITAAARVGVWLTAIALGCVQTITDGGAYDLNNVRFRGKHKPSMNTLSLLRSPHLLKRDARKNITTKPLASMSEWVATQGSNENQTILTAGKKTQTGSEVSKWKWFDYRAIKHVRAFFRSPVYRCPVDRSLKETAPITILDTLTFAHKDMYVSGIFFSQTNYSFVHVSDKRKTKSRGHKLKGTPYNNDQESSNVLSLVEALANDPSKVPPFAPQEIGQILKCNQANKMLFSKTDNVYKQNGLLAGDVILKRSWVRPISLSLFHWQTDKQYQEWTRNAGKLKDKYGWGLETYFLNADGTVNYKQAVRAIQTKIDEGATWIVPVTKAKPLESEAVMHPFYDVALANDTVDDLLDD